MFYLPLSKGVFFISTRTCICESLLTTNVSINVRIVVVYNWYYILKKFKMQLNYWNFALKSWIYESFIKHMFVRFKHYYKHYLHVSDFYVFNMVMLFFSFFVILSMIKKMVPINLTPGIIYKRILKPGISYKEFCNNSVSLVLFFYI